MHGTDPFADTVQKVRPSGACLRSNNGQPKISTRGSCKFRSLDDDDNFIFLAGLKSICQAMNLYRLVPRASAMDGMHWRFTLHVLSSATSSRQPLLSRSTPRQFSMGTAVADMNFIFTRRSSCRRYITHVLSSFSTRTVYHQAAYLSHRSRHATEEAVQTTPRSPPPIESAV
jgi:hypothetical protein